MVNLVVLEIPVKVLIMLHQAGLILKVLAIKDKRVLLPPELFTPEWVASSADRIKQWMLRDEPYNALRGDEPEQSPASQSVVEPGQSLKTGDGADRGVTDDRKKDKYETKSSVSALAGDKSERIDLSAGDGTMNAPAAALAHSGDGSRSTTGRGRRSRQVRPLKHR